MDISLTKTISSWSSEKMALLITSNEMQNSEKTKETGLSFFLKGEGAVFHSDSFGPEASCSGVKSKMQVYQWIG